MKYYIVLLIFVLLASCKTSQDAVYTAPLDYEETWLDTLVVTGSSAPETYQKPVYRAEAERKYDLKHTKLELAFDWAKQHVLGKATLDMTPIFYPIEQVVLDAKQFDIHSIKDVVSGKTLAYEYDDFKLTVKLGKTVKRGELIRLLIDYTAKPEEGPQGGSDAITSDKGLFFINPKGEIADKPRQIWTQGETENNSKWFPTFDKPNERCTQEIYLTVEEDLQTLSNGKLVSSVKNGDGTKTDYWKMDLPHAPYLFMLAIGDFARVKDMWKNVPLEYMVDPPYEPYAQQIFNHTPEMLSFFSEILDYPFPWNKYSQVIAEDYVSGAMENTTGVIFGDFVQKTDRELIDNHNDNIVAHEMFHHWFGDLVTCESWSNLTLNEGFANYSEYLWLEHKYGKETAEEHRQNEMDSYLYMTTQTGTHPLIHFQYADKEDMFDVHSYNKGGLVLHMLRKQIGDEALFASLNKYLKDNAFTAVEVHELRLAFEETTGLDLNWFFNQWFLDQGHPQLNVAYELVGNDLTIKVDQIQDVEAHQAIFQFSVDVALYDSNGDVTYQSAFIDERTDSIVIENVAAGTVAVLDGRGDLLAEIYEERSTEEWFTIFKHSPNFVDKSTAYQFIDGSEPLAAYSSELLKSDFYQYRIYGIRNGMKQSNLQQLQTLAKTDPHSMVRKAALDAVYKLLADESMPIAEEIIATEMAYPVIGAALEIINEYDQEKALSYADKYQTEDAKILIGTLASIYAESGKREYLAYLKNTFTKVDIYQMFNIFGQYKKLLLKQDDATIFQYAKELEPLALKDGNVYKRFLATSTINDAKKKIEENLAGKSQSEKSFVEQLQSLLTQIKETEKDEGLRMKYEEF